MDGLVKVSKMSNDFILGSLAGVFFTVLIRLLILEILRFDKFIYKRLGKQRYFNWQTGFVYTTIILINLVFDLIMWNSVKTHLDGFSNLFISFTLLISIGVSLFLDYNDAYYKLNGKMQRIMYSSTANAGIFSFIIGLICCWNGWSVEEGSNLLTYGGIYIGIASFFVMFFIALTQLYDSQQKDKSFKS